MNKTANHKSLEDAFSIFASSGIHRSNHYKILFNIPQKVISKLPYGKSPTEYNELLDTLCITANVPHGNIDGQGMITMGERYEFPIGKTYDTASFSFYLDNDGISYEIMSIWMSLIFNPFNRTYGYYKDYCSTIYVLLDKSKGKEEKNNFMQIVLEDAYPKTISPFSFTGESGNQVTRFDVTFAVRRVYTDTLKTIYNE